MGPIVTPHYISTVITPTKVKAETIDEENPGEEEDESIDHGDSVIIEMPEEDESDHVQQCHH